MEARKDPVATMIGMPVRRGARARLRAVRDLSRSGTTALDVLRAILTRTQVVLWIGDSHAVCFHRPLMTHTLVRGSNDRSGDHFVWYLGPRLMYSLSAQGLPVRLPRALALMRRVGRLSRSPARIVPVLVAGEIDVRCHLVPRLARSGSVSLDFVPGYVALARSVARELGSEFAVVVVPTPPSATVPVLDQFPVVGSLPERHSAFGELRSSLHAAAQAAAHPPRVLVLDVADQLDDGGGLREGLTDDGCHTNPRGAAIVRAGLRQLLDHPRS